MNTLDSRGEALTKSHEITKKLNDTISNALEGGETKSLLKGDKKDIAIKFHYLKLENWRGFYGGDAEIEFSTDPEKNVTLIIANNEVGKTGLLEAIYWCLFDEIPAHASDPNNLINDDAEKQNNSAAASVTLRLEDKLGVIREFTRILSKEGGESHLTTKKFDPNTQTYKTDTDGNAQDWIHKNILSKQLREIFLFRGESLIKDFGDGENGEKRLKESVNNTSGVTYQLQSLEFLKQYAIDIDELIISKTKKDEKFERDKEKWEKLKKERDKTKSNYDKYKKDVEDLSNEEKKYLNRLGKTNDEDLKKATETIQEETNKIEKRNNDIEELQNQKRSLIKEYGFYCFAIEDLDLYLQDPEEEGGVVHFKDLAHPNREENIKKLLDDGTCICGRDLVEGEEPWISVEKVMKESNTKDEVAARKNITRLSESVKDNVNHFNKTFYTLKKSIKTLESDNKESITKRADAQKIIDDDKGDSAEIREIKRNLEDVQTKLKTARQYKQTEYDALILAKHNAEEAKPKGSSSNNVDPELQDRLDIANELKEILTNSSHDAEKKTKEMLLSNLNKYAEKYAQRNVNFVFSENSYLPQLVSGLAQTEAGLSSGGKKMKALFFGVSLVETALSRLDEEEAFIEPGALFPFVCDAPFSDLDDVNTESAAEMVCKLNCQKIIFVSPGAYKEGVQKTLQRLKNEGSRYFIERKIMGKSNRKKTHIIDGKKYTPFIEDSEYEGSYIRKIS